MQIAHIVPSLSHRHGGPSRSVRQLAFALSRLGHDIELLATTSGEPSEEPGKPMVRIFKRDRPLFLSPSGTLKKHLQYQRFDCIHHHGLWLRTLAYAHRFSQANGSRLVISPRGMMSPWAWANHRWRKLFAESFIHPGAFKDVAGWHATCAEEADDIRSLGFTQPVCVAPNGIDAPEDEAANDARELWQLVCPFTKHARVALFYSRFHRKKRVLELLDLWARLMPADWVLLMVGIPEEYSVASLEDYIFTHGLQHRVKVYDGKGRPAPYPVASLFLLPSHSENFGLVVGEAMAHGVPVLVTDTTPWQQLNQENIGWCVPWEQFGEALTGALAETPAELKVRGTKARGWVLKHYSWRTSARLLAEFYTSLTGQPS